MSHQDNQAGRWAELILLGRIIRLLEIEASQLHQLNGKVNIIMSDQDDLKTAVTALEAQAAANNTELAAIAAALAAANTGNSPVIADAVTRINAVIASVSAADTAAQPPAPTA
jgi:hypothetical protein